MAFVSAIGTDALTSISRRFILKEIVDQFFQSNVLFYRLNASGKRAVRGGTQIEVPVFYRDFTSATNYEGFDLLDTTPQDVFKNAAWGWRHKNVNVSIDGPTMLKNDSPESVANLVRSYFEVARMKLEDMVGVGLFSTATDGTEIDGLRGAIDNGTVAATYAGLNNRTTTNSFWQPAAGALDTTTTTLTLGSMQTVFQAATEGSRHPTLLLGTDAIYNSFWALNQPTQRFPTQPAGQDEQLASAGFTNMLFNNVPVATDSHCPANNLFFLNETYIEWVCHPERDFALGDFQRPINQDAYVAPLWLMAQLIVKNIERQGKMSALTA